MDGAAVVVVGVTGGVVEMDAVVAVGSVQDAAEVAWQPAADQSWGKCL